jgi:AraC-like DNA-binding protein
MSGGHYFKHPRRRSWRKPEKVHAHEGDLAALLARTVGEAFGQLSKLAWVIIPVNPEELAEHEDTPKHTDHPACAEYADTPYCRESWELHLAEIQHHPETHWHLCELGRLCAIVPVTWQGCCLAVVKLASADSMAKADFERHVELLDLLVEHFTVTHAGLLDQIVSVIPAPREPHDAAEQDAGKLGGAGFSHPHIVRAVRFIEENLSDPQLTINRISANVGVHPNYLSPLFVKLCGLRLSRYIAGLRIERAKNLLATTDWQVKRIARESGHANLNWFCHVFSTITGQTPGAYRKTHRAEDPQE